MRSLPHENDPSDLTPRHRHAATILRGLLPFVPAAIAAVFIMGCASSASGPSDHLLQARQEVADLYIAEGTEHVPQRVAKANESLMAAERAHEADPGSAEEENLAYIAHRQARLAAVWAEIETERLEREQARQRLLQLQDEIRAEREEAMRSSKAAPVAGNATPSSEPTQGAKP